MSKSVWGDKNHSHLTPAEAEQVMHMHKSGIQTQSIAHKFHIGTSTVQQIVREYTTCPWEKGQRMRMMHLGTPTDAVIKKITRSGARQIVTVEFEDGKEDKEDWFYFKVLAEAAEKKRR